MISDNLYIEGVFYFINQFDNLYGDDFIKYCIEKNIITLSNNVLCFNYVGAIVYANHLIFVFPKYYKNLTPEKDDAFDRILLYLDIIEKAEKRVSLRLNENEAYYVDSENPFSVYKKILEYYAEFNIYKPIVTRTTNSFEDRIHWPKTIETFHPIIQDNRHIYLDIVSEKNTFFKNHIISELQKFATQKAYHDFGKYTSIFEDPNLDYVNILEDSGSDYCLYIIEQALNVAYADNEILILNLLKVFINNIIKQKSNEIELTGTNAFYHVWEIALKQVFDDKYEVLKEIIPFPKWKYNNSEYNASNTIIPDILIPEENRLLISDAKYYLPQFNNSTNKINKQPGLESITKQIIYKQILGSTDQFQQAELKNSFIFPDSDNLQKDSLLKNNDLKISGNVSFEELPDSIIDILFIPPCKLFKTYLANVKLNLSTIYD